MSGRQDTLSRLADKDARIAELTKITKTLGERATDYWNLLGEKNETIAKQSALLDQMAAALKEKRDITSEAAMVGFNYADGDWAERLFASQHNSTSALTAYAALSPDPQWQRVPEGYVGVPEVPTGKMLHAGIHCDAVHETADALEEALGGTEKLNAFMREERWRDKTVFSAVGISKIYTAILKRARGEG